MPNRPIPNSRLIITKNKKIILIGKIQKCKNLIKKNIIKFNELIDPRKFKNTILNLRGKNFIIDKKSCSIFYEDLIKLKFKIIKKEDPTYHLK